MLRKPYLVLLTVVALGVLVLLALPERSRSRVRIAFGSLFLPLFGLAGSVQAATERAGASTASRASLLARIQSLERENESLRLSLTESRAAVLDADRLRQMLAYPTRGTWRLVPARVIGRDPANWWQSVHLNVGQRLGVVTNLAVFTPEGLVGRVVESGPFTSRVVLVGDPNCPVAAALLHPEDPRKTGDVGMGIIRGASGGDIQGAMVDLSYLSRNAVVKPGQRVVTSGQGGVFPPGLPIGEVVDSRWADAEVFREARVRLAVNLGALDHVWVKLP